MSEALTAVRRLVAENLALLKENEQLHKSIGFHVAATVRVGDVWQFPENPDSGICTVHKVNKTKNRVEFTDGGWNHLDHMLKSGKWWLLGRRFALKSRR